MTHSNNSAHTPSSCACSHMCKEAYLPPDVYCRVTRMTPASELESLRTALREIETICTESAGDCRKRMGTRVGNVLVAARAALAPVREVTR
jgi:hypothetical protein